jgi:hypothetical protein
MSRGGASEGAENRLPRSRPIPYIAEAFARGGIEGSANASSEHLCADRLPIRKGSSSPTGTGSFRVDGTDSETSRDPGSGTAIISCGPRRAGTNIGDPVLSPGRRGCRYWMACAPILTKTARPRKPPPSRSRSPSLSDQWHPSR